jgi:hypothetical protein
LDASIGRCTFLDVYRSNMLELWRGVFFSRAKRTRTRTQCLRPTAAMHKSTTHDNLLFSPASHLIVYLSMSEAGLLPNHHRRLDLLSNGIAVQGRVRYMRLKDPKSWFAHDDVYKATKWSKEIASRVLSSSTIKALLRSSCQVRTSRSLYTGSHDGHGEKRDCEEAER